MWKKNSKGVCPFHNGSLEEARGWSSLEARTGIRGENIDELNSNVWDIQAYYIAQAA